MSLDPGGELLPTAEEIARWRHLLVISSGGCLRFGPDPADPRDVAAYNAACRQLEAEAEAEAGM